jgi:hypothetical protein
MLGYAQAVSPVHNSFNLMSQKAANEKVVCPVPKISEMYAATKTNIKLKHVELR